MGRPAQLLCSAFGALVAAVVAGGALAQSAAPPPDYVLQRFRLPPPVGNYPVGTRSLRVDAGEGQPLEVIVWYPSRNASGLRTPYFSAAEREVEKPAIARNFRWPARILDNLASEPTNSVDGAAVAIGRFPAVIFSHGYWSYPRQNTALMEALAANGYVVLSLAHPGDAADFPTAAGVERTISYDKSKGPDSKLLDAFWSGRTDASRRRALPGFWKTLEGGRLMVSLDRWRVDIQRLANTAIAGRASEMPDDLAQAIATDRIAFVGMSFGGSTSVSACQRDSRCAAAVNLDGFEFDQKLYGRQLRKPILLIQSDWHEFPNSGPPHACFNTYDYAYRPWSKADRPGAVYRYTIRGVRHMGLTDLVLAPRDPVRDSLFGTAEGNRVVPAVNATVLAFLDRTLKGSGIGVAKAASRFPLLERRVPLQKPRGCRVGAPK